MKNTIPKEPVMGLYFPGLRTDENTFEEYTNFQGDKIINFTLDLKKFLSALGIDATPVNKEKFAKHIRVNSKGVWYIKGCIRKNKEPDQDGNIYFAFHNTYEHKEPQL